MRVKASCNKLPSNSGRISRGAARKEALSKSGGEAPSKILEIVMDIRLVEEIMNLIQADHQIGICTNCSELDWDPLEPDGRREMACVCGGDIIGLEEWLFENVG